MNYDKADNTDSPKNLNELLECKIAYWQSEVDRMYFESKTAKTFYESVAYHSIADKLKRVILDLNEITDVIKQNKGD